MSEHEGAYQVGQRVRFWDMRRAEGKIGGWARHEWEGVILKVNRTTCHMQSSWAIARHMQFETVPLARIIEVLA